MRRTAHTRGLPYQYQRFVALGLVPLEHNQTAWQEHTPISARAVYILLYLFSVAQKRSAVRKHSQSAVKKRADRSLTDPERCRWTREERVCSEAAAAAA
eukprot:3396256-Rhodomonas_salina.3